MCRAIWAAPSPRCGPFPFPPPQNVAAVQTAVVWEAFSRVFGEVPLRSSGLRLDRPLLSRGGPFFSIPAVRNRNEVGANTAARQSSRAGADHDCRPGLGSLGLLCLHRAATD